MKFASKIVTCLWMNDNAEEAVELYTSVFPGSRVIHTQYYPDTGKEVHGHEAGKVLTISFELAGVPFTALNGGPQFKHSEAMSLQIMCDSQQEVDHYWSHLGEGGDPAAQNCGWLKDRFGISWQVIPVAFLDLMTSSDTAAVQRGFAAMMDMQKLDMAALQRAFDGK